MRFWRISGSEYLGPASRSTFEDVVDVIGPLKAVKAIAKATVLNGSALCCLGEPNTSKRASNRSRGLCKLSENNQGAFYGVLGRRMPRAVERIDRVEASRLLSLS